MPYGPRELAAVAMSPLCGLAIGGLWGAGIAWMPVALSSPAERGWSQKPPVSYLLVVIGGLAGATFGATYGMIVAPVALPDATWDLVSFGATSRKPFLWFGHGGSTSNRSRSSLYACPF